MKTTENKKKKHNKIVMLGKNESSSNETMISKALIDSGIIHKEYNTIISEEERYRRLKEDIRTMKGQRSDAEKDKLIEEGERIGIKNLLCKLLGNHRGKYFLTRIELIARTR